MPPAVRLRQVALVARELAGVASALATALGVDRPYVDPGVGAFGLENAVFAVGDTFLEVVAPVRGGTTAGRYLDRLGGDGGYMAIFQVADLPAARQRISDLGVRVVWQADLPDIAGTHLHPRDVPGAIVSVDAADPPGSWRWAGPPWTRTAPAGAADRGGVVGLEVAVADPVAAAERWAAVLGVPVADGGAGIDLVDARQRIRFTSAGGGPEVITAVTVALPLDVAAGPTAVEVGGVRLDLVARDEDRMVQDGDRVGEHRA